MRRSIVFLAAATMLAACDTAPQRPAAQKPPDIRTVTNTPAKPAALVPPPMLQDEAPPPKPKVAAWETPAAIVFSPEDEKLRASLPFSPAIAMDPIDGSKISIRAATPTFEYKGKIFYFSSEANRRTFMATPDKFAKGPMMRL